MQPDSIVRVADVAGQPWRNGGGTTRELLRDPDSDDWQIRVSVAEVSASGPFSAFPGVTRWFAVVEGAGVVLSIDGHAHRCSEDGDALSFAGDADTRCRLVGGPTRDLNLMLRGIGGELRRVDRSTSWRPATRACGLYATQAGRCVVDGQVDDEPLSAHALRWWARAPEELSFDGRGWWLAAEVSAVSASTTMTASTGSTTLRAAATP